MINFSVSITAKDTTRAANPLTRNGLTSSSLNLIYRIIAVFCCPVAILPATGPDVAFLRPEIIAYAPIRLSSIPVVG